MYSVASAADVLCVCVCVGGGGGGGWLCACVLVRLSSKQALYRFHLFCLATCGLYWRVSVFLLALTTCLRSGTGSSVLVNTTCEFAVVNGYVRDA